MTKKSSRSNKRFNIAQIIIGILLVLLGLYIASAILFTTVHESHSVPLVMTVLMSVILLLGLWFVFHALLHWKR